jgi:cytidylate kinase
MIVAIDGPAGAGKSTVARMLAEHVGFRYLDTGAMYRALTWLAIREAIDLGDGDQLGRLAAEHPVEFDANDRVLIDGVDVTAAIRQARIDKMVPVVARHPAVRTVMRAQQRELAHRGDSVVEGRDIGTVVCPDAAVKVYLVADPGVRAARRHAERPYVSEAEALDTDPRQRDAQDADRMKPAEDAVEIDTTDLRVEDVVARIEALMRERRPAP